MVDLAHTRYWHLLVACPAAALAGGVVLPLILYPWGGLLVQSWDLRTFGGLLSGPLVFVPFILAVVTPVAVLAYAIGRHIRNLSLGAMVAVGIAIPVLAVAAAVTQDPYAGEFIFLLVPSGAACAVACYYTLKWLSRREARKAGASV